MIDELKQKIYMFTHDADKQHFMESVSLPGYSR